VVFTSNPNPRALPPATLESLARQIGFTGDAEVVGDPERALERARSVAGPAGMVLATGSIYLVAGLAHARRPARARMP
jgi:dihydrofolate synthase/folylpolyglutamate synthase